VQAFRMAILNKYLKSIEYLDPVIGKTCYRLINMETGQTVPFYTEYLKLRAASGSKANSVAAMANDLKSFLSYLFVASEVVSDNLDYEATPLSEIIYGFPQFLLLAKRSSSATVKRTAEILNATPVSENSKNRMLSSVQGFIRESANYQSTLNDLSALGLINTEKASQFFGEELLSKRLATEKEKKILLHNSFLAGCMSGGAVLVESTLFKIKGVHQEAGTAVEKAFPLASILETINNTNSYRNRALWALLAGTGIRISEAFNILLEDIDGYTEEVKIIDPTTRPGKYPDASVNLLEDLKFKGRTTEKTYFLEPFKEIFFNSLKQYLAKERESVNHSVLFINLSNRGRGRPLYLAKNANTHNNPFKKASREAGIFDYTVHSLRHLYGVYALNFLPTGHGYGLPIQTVQLMMGHASIESTKQYAIQDSEIIKKRIALFNDSVLKNNLTWEGTAIAARNLALPIGDAK
jgi:integrase-like protein